jgi:hypothetical protein
LFLEFCKNECAFVVFKIWERDGIISRGALGQVLEGPNFDQFKNEVDDSKLTTGGFHPHVANRLVINFLEEHGFSKNWRTTTHPASKANGGSFSINPFFRFNDNRKYQTNFILIKICL